MGNKCASCGKILEEFDEGEDYCYECRDGWDQDPPDKNNQDDKLRLS